jgi:hypothetical protein
LKSLLPQKMRSLSWAFPASEMMLDIPLHPPQDIKTLEECTALCCGLLLGDLAPPSCPFPISHLQLWEDASMSPWKLALQEALGSPGGLWGPSRGSFPLWKWVEECQSLHRC